MNRAEFAAWFADALNQPFGDAIDYHRQKVNLPTKGFNDVTKGGHDRGFVVAGVTKEDMLNDLHHAVDDAIAKGETLEQFQKQFDAIAAKNGWLPDEKQRAWRARIIYETNLRTSYQAGRYKQMRDPDVLRLRPYWRYVHGQTREPKSPRPSHLALDGLILDATDPVWDKIYPPNGWLCTCGVDPVSKRELKSYGKDGPDPAPELGTHEEVDPATGDKVQVTNGCDLGWDYAPGQTWERGLVPAELQKPLPASDSDMPRPDNLTPIGDIATPIKAKALPAGKSSQVYEDAFLKEFGATRDQGAMFRDKADNAVVISSSMFRTATGAPKANKLGRGPDLPRLAEAIKDPDEIWVSWEPDPKGGKRLVRKYLRYDPTSGGYAVFEWSKAGWSGVTAFPPKAGKSAKTQANYLENQRSGALLYRRSKA